MHTSNDNARGLSSVAKALWRENGEPHVVEQKLTVGQKELRLLVCTFNVGNAPLNQTELCHWLPVEENEYDLIAIGLQESTYNNRSSINKGSRAFDSGTLRAASFVANEGAAYPSSRSLSLRAGLPRSLSSDGSLGDPLEDLASPVSGSTDTDTRGVGSSHPSTCEPQSVALMFDDSDEDRSGALHTTPRTSHKALNDGLSPMSSPRKNRPSSISQSLRKTRKRGGAERLKMLVGNHLGDSYSVLASCRRMQMRLRIYVHESRRSECRTDATEVGGENTGIAGVVANKGGLCCKVQIGGTVLAFVSCHLQAHEGQENCRRRNASCAEILSGIRLGASRKVDLDNQFHHVFWMGDMNYRVDFGLPFEDQRSRVLRLIEEEAWSEIAKGDELQRELAAGNLLSGFTTPECTFPPTFKLEPGTIDKYSAKRVPSYTDRVLWKSMPGHAPKLQLLSYESQPLVSTSDHKPVLATFSLRLAGDLAPVLAQCAQQGTSRAGGLHSKIVFDQLQGIGLTEMDSQLTGGLSDPYIVAESDPIQLMDGPNPKSEIRRRTVNPLWHKSLTCNFKSGLKAEELRECHIRLMVWDYDQGSSDDLIGSATIALDPIIDTRDHRAGIRDQHEGEGSATGHRSRLAMMLRKASSVNMVHAHTPAPSRQASARMETPPSSGRKVGNPKADHGSYHFEVPVVRNGMCQGHLKGRATFVARPTNAVHSPRRGSLGFSSLRRSSLAPTAESARSSEVETAGGCCLIT